MIFFLFFVLKSNHRGNTKNRVLNMNESAPNPPIFFSLKLIYRSFELLRRQKFLDSDKKIEKRGRKNRKSMRACSLPRLLLLTIAYLTGLKRDTRNDSQLIKDKCNHTL